MKSIAYILAALLAVVDAATDNAMMYARIGRRQAKGVQVPKEMPRLNAPTSQGCFKSAGDMKMINGSVGYNSIGECATNICKAAGYAVGASTMGAVCYCGNKYPPKSDLVDDKECNAYCTGWDWDACGGETTFSVYNTGKTLAVPFLNEPAKSSSGSSTDKASPTKSSGPAQTTVQVQGETITVAADVEEQPKSGKNTAGIVAGTVVGIVVLAAALGGGYLFMRRKRNKEIEEEHRRNAAVNAFIGKPPGSSGGMSMTDSRMDPVLAHRRMSDGSIADNQDYSRRILRVTNA